MCTKCMISVNKCMISVNKYNILAVKVTFKPRIERNRIERNRIERNRIYQLLRNWFFIKVLLFFNDV